MTALVSLFCRLMPGEGLTRATPVIKLPTGPGRQRDCEEADKQTERCRQTQQQQQRGSSQSEGVISRQRAERSVKNR